MSRPGPAPLADPAAAITLLSGDDWGPWLAAALQAATQSVLVSVYMISPYWRVPNRHGLNLLGLLQGCGQRGLTCRAVLADPRQINTREAFNARSGTALIAAGWKVRTLRGPHVLHEKLLVLDERITLIGSHNLSKASLTSNHDTTLAVESARLAQQAKRLFWTRWRAGVAFAPPATRPDPAARTAA